jgi:hypothetical protein
MMGIRPQQIERSLQIIVAKPLAWALYAGGVIVACMAMAGLRGLRSLLPGGTAQENQLERKEGQWQRQS